MVEVEIDLSRFESRRGKLGGSSCQEDYVSHANEGCEL